jgi:ABC-type molybdate transport system substrate-binding protein
VAAEIKIMCPAPMRTAIVDLAARFERKTPHKITFIHLPSSFIVDRVKGGEAVDVTILTARASDDLIKEGKLARRVDIARSSIGLAVRAGAPKPPMSPRPMRSSERCWRSSRSPATREPKAAFICSAYLTASASPSRWRPRPKPCLSILAMSQSSWCVARPKWPRNKCPS